MDKIIIVVILISIILIIDFVIKKNKKSNDDLIEFKPKNRFKKIIIWSSSILLIFTISFFGFKKKFVEINRDLENKISNYKFTELYTQLENLNFIEKIGVNIDSTLKKAEDEYYLYLDLKQTLEEFNEVIDLNKSLSNFEYLEKIDLDSINARLFNDWANYIFNKINFESIDRDSVTLSFVLYENALSLISKDNLDFQLDVRSDILRSQIIYLQDGLDYKYLGELLPNYTQKKYIEERAFAVDSIYNEIKIQFNKISKINPDYFYSNFLMASFTGDLKYHKKLLNIYKKNKDSFINEYYKNKFIFLIKRMDVYSFYSDKLDHQNKLRNYDLLYEKISKNQKYELDDYISFTRSLLNNVIDYDERFIIDKIRLKKYNSDHLMNIDIYAYNITRIVLKLFGKKKMTKEIFNKRKSVVDSYKYNLSIEKNGFKNFVNMKWVLHNVYVDYEPNIALKALYDMEIEISKYMDEISRNSTDSIPIVPNVDNYEILALVWWKIGRIKENKKDSNGSANAFDKSKQYYSKFFNGYDDTKSKIAIKYSDLLVDVFRSKWNIKPYGKKRNCCRDLELAAKLNPDDYYDYFLKNCN